MQLVRRYGAWADSVNDTVQGSAKRCFQGLVNLIATVAFTTSSWPDLKHSRNLGTTF